MEEQNNYYQDVTTPANCFSYFTPRPPVMREREQMFEKVLTPSDVGKLNRLVIPKHQAEKYFPLDSSSSVSTEKDARQSLILNFEDGSGKPWRFRYSYWSSSQSYVLTKGWSRFVKEKELGAGDVVSFWKETSGFHRFFIDFFRRGGTAVQLRPVFFPTPSSLYHHTNFYNGLDPASLDHLPSFGIREGMPAMILDSVPVVPGRTPPAFKSVKLFGVNLEYPISDDGEECSSSSSNHNFPTMEHDQLLPSPSTELMSDDLLKIPDLSLSLQSNI